VEHDLMIEPAVLAQFVERASVTAKDTQGTFILKCNGDGTATVQSQTTNTGAFVASFPIEYDGEFQLAFNSKAFLSVMSHAFSGEKKVRMICGGGGKGGGLRVVFRPMDDDKGWYVLAPIILEVIDAPGAPKDELNILPAKRRGNR
jgi:DNA polymerase III sliding clamp (beta) subunit (PCNA family)